MICIIDTSISRIIISFEIKWIGSDSFPNCEELQQVDYSNASKLQINEDEEFWYTSIKKTS